MDPLPRSGAPDETPVSGEGPSRATLEAHPSCHGSALIQHLLPALFLLAAVAALFRLPLFLGYRFIGNSDRWNHHLAFAQFHTDNLLRGTLAAWSETLLAGFDTLAAPGNFPSPVFALPALLGTPDVVAVFAWADAATLALTLLATYWAIIAVGGDRLGAVAGALVSGLSIFSLLKLAQNSNEYIPVLLAPILFCLVHTTDRANLGRRFAVLTVLLWFGVYVLFLQPLAYVLTFALAYAAWRWVRGERAPLVTLAPALGLGALLATPRLLLQMQDVLQSGRVGGGGGITEFVGPALFLRYLDGNIFGRSSREAAAYTEVINLSEGNLLFASAFGSLLLLVTLLWPRSARVAPRPGSRPVPTGFLAGFVLAVLIVTHWEPAYRLFALLFLNISFLHTRFVVAALLPIALLTGLALTREPGWRLTLPRALGVGAMAAFVLVASGTDLDGIRDRLAHLAGRRAPVFVHVPGSDVAWMLTSEALRVVVLGVAFALLSIARWPLRWVAPGTFKTAVAVVIAGQSMLFANQFLNGPQTRTERMPFEHHDLVMASGDEFRSPTPEQLQRMHVLLDNDRYRSVLICPRALVAVDCSTAIGLRWRIRLADGYTNGLSKRYLTLPWPEGSVGARAVRFLGLEPASVGGLSVAGGWRLLALLNVRNAVWVDRAFFTNRGLEPERLRIEHNPSPYIYPRAYFASQVESVSTLDAAKAVSAHFASCPAPPSSACDQRLTAKHPVDYVEGKVAGAYDATGEIRWHFAGDSAVLAFPASATRRFLVINEAYHRRWRAESGGRALPIYPTNLVMRGIPVPEGVGRVILRYRSVIDDTWLYLAVVIPAGLIAGALLRRPVRAVVAALLDRTARPGR